MKVRMIPPPVSCRIRFQNGEEWEIQAIYQWNRPNWRLDKSASGLPSAWS